MALTREQAIERLEARRRADYCDGSTWFEVGRADWKGAPIGLRPDEEVAAVLPSCKLCPVLDLALAGGMDPLEAVQALEGMNASVGEVVDRIQPYTGLTRVECIELIDFHDEPDLFNEDEDDYLAPIRAANAEWPNIV